MHCLHVAPTYWPAVRYGGTVTAVHGLCKALRERGHRVTVLTTDADGPDRLSVPLCLPVDVDGVEVHYFPLALYRPCYAPAMRAALDARLRSADVVHLHSVFLWPTWAAARASRRAGVPYIVSPRGMLVGDLLRRRSWLLKAAWLRLVGRDTLAGAAAIHVTSEVEREELHRLGYALRHVRTVENGIDMSTVPAASSDAPVSRPTASPFVLYLGRLSWKKGLERLVGALRYVPEARLVIAGNDDEGYWPALQRVIAAEGVSHRVSYRGPAYGDSKWALMRAAACFVLPSYSENFGNTVLEAMSAGCPVIVTREVGASALVAEAGAGLVVDGDAQSVGQAIARLLADSDLSARMGRAGEHAAKHEHSWHRRADEMLALYRDVTQHAAARPEREAWR